MIRTQGEYRHELPYYMNMEIQKQHNRNQYMQYCDEQRRLKSNAEIISNVPRVRQKQLSITEIQMKVRFYENRSRKKLLALFEQERAEYDAKRPRHSIDDQIAFMEKQAAQIQQNKQEQARLFADQMYELQQRQNNPEVREARQRLNDAECRVAWDLQRHQLIERRKLEREIQMRLDQIVIDDYKAHQRAEEQNRLELVQRARDNAAALQHQMTLQSQRKAAEKARELEEDSKALMLEQERREIERLERDVEARKAALLQEELQVLINIQEQKRLEIKRELYRDGQRIREEAEREAQAQREKKLQEQHDLFQLQTIYCAQVAERRREVQAEAAALETKLIALQRERDEEQRRIELDRFQKQKQLAKDCEAWNVQNSTKSEEKILQDKINKQKELDAALEELRIYEEQKLSQMRADLAKQKALNQWLSDDLERKKQLREWERNEARKEVGKEVETTMVGVRSGGATAQAEVDRLNGIFQEIRQIPMYQAPRPRPKRLWYH